MRNQDRRNFGRDSGTQNAGTSNDRQHSHSDDSIGCGRSVDSERQKKEFGTTLDEAQHRLDLQIEIGDLDQRLAASEAGTFAGLWIQHEPDFKVITKFTDDGESTIRPYISEGNLEDLVDVGKASSTLASLRSAQTAAIEKAMSLSAVFESGINVFDNRVEIYTLDREALKSVLDGAGLTLSNKVNIVEVPHLSVPTTDIHGGLALTTCTSGFSVKHTDGTKGVTSAAHCPSNQSYLGTQLPKRDQYYRGTSITGSRAMCSGTRHLGLR